MKMASSHHLLIFLLAFFFASIVGATLPQDEVQALKDIANTLGKKDWDFQVDPCSGARNWTTNETENAVKCDPFIARDNFSHVVSIVLKRQNLPGKLPPELVRLPYLQEIDLTRNYLNGTIPRQWGSMMNLVNISLLGNRLTGQIPEELGNINTLKSLVLEFNQFSGNLPLALGNLTNIERLHLTSNNFTGELPLTFTRLIALKQVLLGDNQFSGKIPGFIGSWTSLELLIIQGSGLSGPIPSEIFLLRNLSELRISDLSGSDSTFPLLNDGTKLKVLILKSCNINGKLPENLGKMSTLKTLDLSFNKLSGPIPSTFNGLSNPKYIYLTGNHLTGPVPAWSENAGNNGKYRDLSYNNFTDENPGQQDCQRGKVNLFASSLMVNNVGTITCVESIACPNTFQSLHINCGGKEKTIGDTKYDDDSDPAGPATYKKSGTNWAFSSTGHFLDNESTVYISHNISRLSMPNVELYTDARLSPSSLTYYGFCLRNGHYTVKLHFAEIMFSDDNTYSSLGRRVFDVYIQEKRMLKDFNIANEAGGVGMEVIKEFSASVTKKTLEIRFYWAGKGTTAIPNKSVYGPLISAISVNHELKDLDLQTGLFTLRQIKAATNNFDISNKIGEGGFGPVYKGFLSDGSAIAVKQLSSKSKQGNREFINEIGIISALRHPCLVKLYGCCVEGDQLLLVYEYMENNSLARALFGPEQCHLNLDWSTRHKICVGIARGLAFLHEESRLRIVHRDIKATNVLLDKELNAKISDFGLAKLHEEDNTHISTRIAGTYGYMAPEYAMHGYLTDKADVYSFGIVALEIVSGRSNTIRQQKEDYFHLLDWAHFLKEKGYLMELVDRKLGSDFNKEQVMVMINVAFLCTNASSSLRPSMSSVLSMLEGRTLVPELISDQSEVADKMKLEAMRRFYQETEENQISEVDTQTVSLIGPSTGSSTSAADLYPVRLDSSYWEKRS